MKGRKGKKGNEKRNIGRKWETRRWKTKWKKEEELGKYR